jgi:3-hexulose-6-phosphate synthase
MKLQLALDTIHEDHAMDLAKETAPFVDIFEVGTPLLKFAGVRIIDRLRDTFPKATILADTKTMDTGAFEAEFCFRAGADIVTVLGVADPSTIQGAVDCAKKHGKAVMVDLLNVPKKVKAAKACAAMGVGYIAVHTGIDQQKRGGSPLKDLKKISRAVSIPVAVAGGINLSSLDWVVPHHPAIVVVGGAITGSPNPAEAARTLHERINPHVRNDLRFSAENPLVPA